VRICPDPILVLIVDYSPYTRETYRYTPLLALLLAPTEWQHPSFGKYVFAACDLINGALIRHMLLGGIIPRNGPAASKDGPSEGKDSGARRAASLATLYAALHLLNPLIFTISTRGSSESVLATLVLATLACALRGRWDAAAVGLGLATHWKVYPVVYGVACVSAIAGEGGWGWRAWVNVRTARFALVSAGTFGLLGLGCYLM
jgi:phosphatidylinositol glycan class M